MRSPTPAGFVPAVAALGSLLLLAAGCKGGPQAPTPVPIPGATLVRGTERLAWSQTGDLSGIRFRAWVDDTPVFLDAATCDTSTPEAQCTAPLPPMTDGGHTIALTSVLADLGLESERSESLLVQKVSGRPSAFSSLPDAADRTRSLGLQGTLQLAGNLTFATDIVARDIQAPAQLAWIPDGRLLVAERDGGVRLVRSGSQDSGVRALDARHTRSMLGPSPGAAPGLAIHPDFARNHLVYVAALAEDRPGSIRLRVVRLREAGDTLGEPVTVFETAVTARVPGIAANDHEPARSPDGPKMTFGPDGLLYVALPSGFEFHREPWASTPDASMLRITDDGRLPGVGRLTGVRARPLGFAWDLSSHVLWLAFADGSGVAVLEPAAGQRSLLTRVPAQLRLPVTTSGTSGAARTLMIPENVDAAAIGLIRAAADPAGKAAAGSIKLTVPAVVAHLPDRIGDIVAGAGGTWFLVTSNGISAGGADADGSDVIVRITPVSLGQGAFDRMRSIPSSTRPSASWPGN